MDRKMKKWREKFISLVLTAALVMAGMPIEPLQSVFHLPAGIVHADVVYEDIVGADWSSGTVYNIFNPEYLVKYSQAYYSHAENHQHDTLVIAFGEGASGASAKGFLAIGTETYPFKGTIKISSVSANVLNLPDTFFDYVYDSVQIIDSADGGGENAAAVSTLQITRIDNNVGTPILAKHVCHDADGGEVQNWKVKVAPYNDGTNTNQYNFGGIIGEMETGAQLKLDVEDISTGVVYGTDDTGVGYLCGSMTAGSSLTVQSISGSNTGYSVTGTAGHAGGLVGNMASGAVLTMRGSALNTSAVVSTTADSSYAGGLVGYNDGGTIVFEGESAGSPYPVQGTVSGTAGAGGIFGYYVTTREVSFDVSQYNVDVTVNGTGSVGGLFGVLNNAGGSVEITALDDNKTVTAAHSDGSADHYGGLIGKYTASVLADSLTVGNVTASVSQSGGSYSYYGGGIGQIDGVAYVKFDGFTASASNAGALTFGGLVAGADSAFVDAKDVTVSAPDFKGGGVVGSLANGVLRLSGTTNLAGAKSSTSISENDAVYMGQIVGFRDNAPVFAEQGWSLTRSTTPVSVDDIGAWGEIILFGDGFPEDSVLEIKSGHTIEINTPTASIGNIADYAKASWGMQIDDSQNEIISFKNTSYGTLNLKSQTITLAADVDLTGTGLGALTRDNLPWYSDSMRKDPHYDAFLGKCIFEGMFIGGDHTITFAIGDRYGEQNDIVYRHTHNGLFAITNGVNIQNVTLGGTVRVQGNRLSTYIGAVAARAKGDFTATNIIVTMNYKHSGSSTLYMGGMLGQASGEIEAITVSNSSFNGAIDGDTVGGNSNEGCYLGGMIGSINHNANQARTWTFSNVTLSGKIENAVARHSKRIGGLIGYIAPYTYNVNVTEPTFASRTLTLNGVTVSGLEVSGATGHYVANDTNPLTSGGLLGYAWYNTDVLMTNVIVENGSKVTLNNSVDGYGDTAGLVYQATGHWTITKLDIQDITVAASKAKSFGMIVNKGWYTGEKGDSFYAFRNNIRSAIYLELPEDYFYHISSANLGELQAGIVYDELVAYSAYYHENQGDRTTQILKNGQGIVSIHTGLTMNGSSASNSYQAQTERGKTANSFTRYYYNLDTVTGSTQDSISGSPQKQLMSWGLRQYACQNLRQYFYDIFNGTINDQIYDMNGYSWYPINLDSDVTVNGTYTFYNEEFEESESHNSTNQWSSLAATQHYLMQEGLFYNVSSNLTIGNMVLAGTIGAMDNSAGTGALICGTISGDSATSPAKAEVTGSISLAGIKVHNLSTYSEYAPLLINRADSFATLMIKNVSNTAAYTVGGVTINAATSLIGNAGINGESKNINVTFSGMKLDARMEANIPAEIEEGVYHTKKSIFTKATLLNQFQYDSGSAGVYNYAYNEDWGIDAGGKARRNVTYGKEVGYTSENTGTQYPNMERWYSGQSHEGGYFTNPVNSMDTVGTEISSVFQTQFLPYVAVSYHAGNKTYQLEVNHGAATFGGCGTYNDPYIISTGDQLETIAKILKGTHTEEFEIYVPTAGINTTWCENKGSHTKYIYKSDSYYPGGDMSQTALAPDDLRKYLAGAYYKLGASIELTDSQFNGLGDTTDEFAIFRGVIVGGDGFTITNRTKAPLIAVSYGSVVKDIDIIVDNSSIVLEQNSKDVFPTCKAYGAVIGKVMGGDNIIDNVGVGFSNSTVITLGGDYAQLVPVGGYVGVVLNGGVYFRNMEEKRETDAIKGLRGTEIVRDSSGNTDLVEEDNLKWLYVNPVIGRVIKGFAITETDVYRPFEDGTREESVMTYTDTQTEKYSEAVTMRNSNKNYSIADLNKNNGNKLLVNVIVETNKLPIEIPDAQALFVMSLIVNSGAGCSGAWESTDYSTSKGYACAYDHQYKVARLAQYDHVSEDIQSDDYKRSALVKGDANYARSNIKNNDSNVVPYIIGNYTKTVNHGTKWYARCISTTSTRLRITMTSTQYILPDGFKGIGDIYGAGTELKVDGALFPYMDYVHSGSNITESQIDLNMSLKHYDLQMENYTSPQGNYGVPGGFGLFNILDMESESDGESADIQNLTLSGKVDYQVLNASSGESIAFLYDSSIDGVGAANGADSNRIIPVGALAGNTSAKCVLDNIQLDGIIVNGVKNTGGMIGQLSSQYIINNCGTTDNSITVRSGVCVGGLIGYVNSDSLYLTINGNTSKNDISLEDNANMLIDQVAIKFAQPNNEAYVAGGMIGYARNRTGSLKVSNYDIKSKDTASFIGIPTDLDEDSEWIFKNSSNQCRAGGMIGYMIGNNNFTNITVRGLNVQASYAGGLFGRQYCGTSSSTVITDVLVDGENHANIIGAHYIGGIFGEIFIQYPNVVLDMNISHALVQNYKIIQKVYGKNDATKEASCGGIGGVVQLDGSDGYRMHKILLHDIAVCKNEIMSYNLRGTYDNHGMGALFGYTSAQLSKKGYINIYGYNVLINDNILKGGEYQQKNNSLVFRETLEYSCVGDLIGANRANEAEVKLVGVSIQGTRTKRLSGSMTSVSSDQLGENGYIIFADYNGRSLSESTRGFNRSDIYSGTNVSQTGSDNFPYVTSSPKCGIALTQFLTGDGVSAWTYNASAVNQIITDLQAQTQPARAYKNAYAAVTEDDLNLLVSTLRTNGKYTGYQAEMGSQAGVSTNYNFPVIVIDDANKETTTTLINTYLRLLTNTDYDFAKGTLADGTTSAASIFSVALGKCTFDPAENKFDVTFDSSCLLNTDGQHFYMGSTYDTSNPNGQFSLIDVKFFDPADTSKVAYHLYVPVLVKKMMLYDFSASILSGTNYRMDAYTTRGNSLIENLGNPVTMEARYTYRQSEAEWIAAINAGESVLRTYDKKLRVTDHTGSGLPAGTRMILIDANQNNQFYTATLAETAGVYTTGDNNDLDLNRFKDESDSAFKSVLFNDFFDIIATENAEGSFDLVTGCNTEEEYIAAGATVRDNSGNYYKLHDESEEGKGAYSLSVAYKSGVSDENGYIQEDYYLTFYTQAAENTIYHLEFSAPVSFGSTVYPSRMRTQYPTHLFTGDIYEETFEITDPSSGTEISLEGNNRIGATFTSRVKLKDTAGPTIVGYLDMQSVSIYQSFLIMLNRANRDGSQEQGIKAVPDVNVVAYTVGATDVLANMSEISPANHTITSNYIELRNNRNLKTDLKNAYNNNRSTVAITATFMLAYNTEDDIVLQFPTRESESETSVGTKIGGSSNISADASAAAYSKMAESAWDNTLYYCMISPSASLIYSSDDAANVNGEYYQLGINARDLTETELLNGYANMKTLGTYNVVQLRNLDEVQSMKITLTLREKGAYDTTLPIADYIKADSVVVKNHSGNAVAKSESSTEKEYVYVVNTPADVMSYDISKQLYTIPVTFSVYTGATLEARNKDYSNYMIQMQVELYDAADAGGTVIGGSSVKDHVIYTNAKLLTEVIERLNEKVNSTV